MASISTMGRFSGSCLQKVGSWLGLWSVLTLSTWAAMGQPTKAATKVKFTYGPFGQSLTVKELKTFIETGKPSSKLKFFLNTADQEPETVRRFLAQDVKINLRLADRILYFLPGEYALFQAGQIFHTPGRVANIQALRSGVIQSLSDDNKISLIEFLEKYPLSEMTIDGVRLARAANQIDRIVSRFAPKVETGAAIANEILESLVCDCESVKTEQVEPTIETPPTPEQQPTSP